MSDFLCFLIAVGLILFTLSALGLPWWLILFL